MFKKLLAVAAALAVFALAVFYSQSQSPILTPPTALTELTQTQTAEVPTTEAPTTEAPTTEEPTTEEPTTEAPTQPSTEGPTVETALPPTDSYVLSFAGDCTFADNFTADETTYGTFTKVVGTDYAYPMALVKSLFDKDDLTLVNLEFALTTYDPTPEEIAQLKLDEKTYRFRGDPAYVQVLTQGGIEFVSAANNHSTDYGWPGHRQTQSVLTDAGIRYATWGSNCLMTTESGLTVGIYAASFHISVSDMQANIAKLRQDGAQIVICSFHWGEERTYAPTEEQQTVARQAIDAGADIVYGHHPHVLQPMERYNGGLILYSMGNFSFGGNRNPADKDTAVIQQQILRNADGSVSLGETVIVPCSITGTPNSNNYQPTPYAQDSEGYLRVLSKLDGSYAKAWLEAQQPSVPTESTGSTAPAQTDLTDPPVPSSTVTEATENTQATVTPVP